MTGQDRAHVAAAQHRGETALIAQFDRGRQIEDARHRRVVHGQDRAQRGGRREDLGEPLPLRGRHLAVVGPGHRGVEGHDAQAVELVDPVDGSRGVGGLGGQQLGAEGCAIVVVAHDPHDPSLQALRERLDDGPHAAVGVGLAEVGQVSREHQRIGADARGLDRGRRAREVRLGVDVVVQRCPAGAQVGVAQVQQHPLGTGVLGVAHLDPSGPSGTAATPA